MKDKWKIQSTNTYKIINNKNVFLKDNKIGIYEDGKEIIDSIELKEYSFYYITLIGNNNSNIYALYCSPVYEDNFVHLHIKNMASISIGSQQKNNHIVYNNKIINDVQAQLYFLNGTWWIKNYDKRFNTFVNGEPVFDTPKMLSNGDRIYVLGLSIIILNKEFFINNPLNQVSYDKSYFYVCKNTEVNTNEIDDEDDDDYSKYINNNYFLRNPRMMNLPEDSEIKILEPQSEEKRRELPLALIMGSSFSMAAMTLISITQTLDNFASGRSNVKSLIFSLLMSGTMLATSLLIPLLNRKYSNKIKMLNEKDAEERYLKYIQNKMDIVEKRVRDCSEILYSTYVTPEECADIIINNKPVLWERQNSDKDFLTVRLGIGNVPSNIKLSYSIPEGREVNNETQKLMNECVEKARILKDVPVLVSFVQKKICAILYQKEELKYKYLQNIILQLIAFQSYDELKLVFLLKNNMDKKWDFVKMMPYVWNNSKEFRFFADDFSSKRDVLQYLEN